MEKWSRGYAILKTVVRFALWLSHKKITVSGSERIPGNQPLIFAPNHQNALMDPLAVLCTNKTQPVWLARADIFKAKWARPILRFLKILPVYRIRDGKDQLSKNDAVFDAAIRVLENKMALALFPEAAHSGKRQMLAHKKAIPRIAFMAEEKHQFQLGLQIVPVGLYYDHYWNFNRSLIVWYGRPIAVSGFANLYAQNPHQATMALKDRIEEELKKVILNIESETSYNFIESVREQAFPLTNAERKPFSALLKEKKLVEHLCMEEKENPSFFQEIRSASETYAQKLAQYKLTTSQLNHYPKKRAFAFLMGSSLLSVVSLPVALAGFLLNALPFFAPRFYFRNKVKDPVFYSTFHFVSGLLLFSIFYFILMAVLLVYGHWLAALLVAPSGLLLGKISFALFEHYQNLGKQWVCFIFKTRNPKHWDELQQAKSNLLKRLSFLH